MFRYRQPRLHAGLHTVEGAHHHMSFMDEQQHFIVQILVYTRCYKADNSDGQSGTIGDLFGAFPITNRLYRP